MRKALVYFLVLAGLSIPAQGSSSAYGEAGRPMPLRH